ncbi:MAG TPA: CaiB/BaiF CoA-transferase family protein [SAR202 cluster bacterium]|nr:CaiB/BaiF CoA-transferase family protein [SAR202 cluster bacterium]
MTLPYEGIRIIDFTQVEQGPVGTQVLGDYGADVVKIERIDIGEIGRGQQPQINGVSLYYMADNRNKRSFSLDLRTPEAKEIVHEMVKDADVVASNFRPGVMERMGFGYEELKKINPRIIWSVASGWGQTGPYEKRIGQDLVSQALGGLMSLTGDRDGPPRAVGTFIGDYLGGMMIAQGIMAALAAREKTGRGQVVETNLMDGVIASHLQENAAALNADWKFPRAPKGIGHSDSGPFYAIYECKDGKYYTLMGAFVPDGLGRLSKALEIEPSLADDPLFENPTRWNEGSPALRAALEKAFKKFTRAEVEERFDANGLPPGSVYDLQEVFEDPQVVHNNMVVEAEHPVYGKVRLTGFPVKLSDTPATLRRSPPTVGEHNEEMLRELGYTDAQIQELQTSGVTGSENIKRANGATGS